MDHPNQLSEPLIPGPAERAGSDPTPLSERVTPEGSEAASPEDDDRELARRLRDRDASALATLYRAHRRRAFGLAYRVLDDATAAEDAVHAGFLALWEQAGRVDPDGGRLGALVMTIVHRRAVDVARRRARAQQHEARRADDDAGAEGDPSVEIPDEQAQLAFARVLDDADATRRRLASALARLPEAQRAVVELAYFDGMTHRAIAEQLGLPDGTVKSRLRLGLGHLRDALKSREEGA